MVMVVALTSQTSGPWPLKPTATHHEQLSAYVSVCHVKNKLVPSIYPLPQCLLIGLAVNLFVDFLLPITH